MMEFWYQSETFRLIWNPSLAVAPNRSDSFNPFDFLNFDTFDLWRSSPEKSATYSAAGLARALPLPEGLGKKEGESEHSLYDPSTHARGGRAGRSAAGWLVKG